ncbi:hypothetical protein RHSIM_RhsimUnG0009600 [Rhododendron simsii]|uniref:Aminotransferase-like plant mobile domain-containing protein n=1 Tax=Rhododendron simsii TaxID=118357 RepID=A0A834FWD5_RHOSS|nr:hypothetical protein RHSIM_RhsimUnG0009600 [Rhododendron simsii]
MLNNLASVQILRASRALEPIRLSSELSIRKNNTNIDLLLSRWSRDTHTFVFPWGEGGPTLQDSAVLMRFGTRGTVAFDLSSVSPADMRLVERLRRAYTEAGKRGSRFDKDGSVWAAPKSGKTSWGCWLRYFFKNLPPPDTVPSEGQATEFNGRMLDSDLHLAGFLVYWLPFFVIPDFPYEGSNHTILPFEESLAKGEFVLLRPLFMGSLFQHLDQVHADTERSMGRYDMVSVVHTQFLMAFCFEHFPSLAPSAAELNGGRFLPRPYVKSVDGVLLTSFFSEERCVIDFRVAGAEIPAAAFAAACPCSLPTLCAEGGRSVLYRLDRVARQFGYEQGTLGPAPPLKSYAESIRRFTRPFVVELSVGHGVVTLPENDRETFFTANDRLAWRWNLDSFTNFVRGNPVLHVVSTIYHCNVSLRSPKARKSEWRGKSSYRAPSDPTRAATHGVTIAEAISTILHRRIIHVKAKEQEEENVLSHVHSDSSIDDAAPISQSFKMRRTSQASSSGKAIAEGKKVIEVDDSPEEVDNGTGDNNNGGSDENEDDDDDVDSRSRSEDAGNDPGDDNSGDNDGDGDGDGDDGGDGHDNVKMEVQPEIEDDEEDKKDSSIPDLVHRGSGRRSSSKGFLTVPDINEPALEVTTVEQAAQNDTLIPHGTQQTDYITGDFDKESSFLAEGAALQHQVEASTSRGKNVVEEDDAEVREIEAPANHVPAQIFNEVFFEDYQLSNKVAAFLFIVRNQFPETFLKFCDLYSLTMDRLQLNCLHVFLRSVTKIPVEELSPHRIEEEGLWKQAEEAKAALVDARVTLTNARNAMVTAEEIVK